MLGSCQGGCRIACKLLMRAGSFQNDLGTGVPKVGVWAVAGVAKGSAVTSKCHTQQSCFCSQTGNYYAAPMGMGCRAHAQQGRTVTGAWEQ